MEQISSLMLLYLSFNPVRDLSAMEFNLKQKIARFNFLTHSKVNTEKGIRRGRGCYVKRGFKSLKIKNKT